MTNTGSEEELKAIELLKRVIDPEVFINIVDMGLIYNIDFSEPKKLKVLMTLSSKGCPMGESILNDVNYELSEYFEDRKIEIELVWHPEWTIDLITEEGKKLLGI